MRSSLHDASRGAAYLDQFCNTSQTELVDLAKQLVTALHANEYGQLFSILQKISRVQMDPKNITDPLKVLMILAEGLADPKNQWEHSHVQHEIARQIRRLTPLIYRKHKEEKKKVDKTTRDELKSQLEQLKRHLNEEKKAESGLICELDTTYAVIDYLTTTEKWWEKVNAILDLISGDTPFSTPMCLGFAAIRSAYQAVKRARNIQWYEAVLYMDALKEAAKTDIDALTELDQLLKKHKREDWRLLYHGLEALREIAEETKDVKITEKVLQGFPDPNGGKDLKGFKHFLEYKSYRCYNNQNWRIREKAVECLILLCQHPQEPIQLAAQTLVQHYRSRGTEKDKRIVYRYEHPEEVLGMRYAMREKEWKDTESENSDYNALEASQKQRFEEWKRAWKEKCQEDEKFQDRVEQEMKDQSVYLVSIESALQTMKLGGAANEAQAQAEVDMILTVHQQNIEARLEAQEDDLREIREHSERATENLGKLSDMLQENRKLSPEELQERFKEQLNELGNGITAEMRDVLQNAMEANASSTRRMIRELTDEIANAKDSTHKSVKELDQQIRDIGDRLDILCDKDAPLQELVELLESERGWVKDSVKSQKEILKRLGRLEAGQEETRLGIADIRMTLAGLTSKLSDVPSKLSAIQSYVQQDTRLDQDLEVYIPVRGAHDYDEEKDFDMEEQVGSYLQHPTLKVLLIKGYSGAGKSTWMTYLYRKLWRQYKAGDAIPILIELGRSHNCEDRLIETALEQEYGFNATEIQELKQNHSFVFLLDGYDETGLKTNLYRSNKMEMWRSKVIFTVRDEYGIDENRFKPIYKRKLQHSLYERYVIRPFTDRQITNYLQKMVQVQDTEWKDWKRYETEIDQVSGLREVIRTPFLLHMVGQVLPEVIHKIAREERRTGRRQPKQLKRQQIYNMFTGQGYANEEIKNQPLISRMERNKFLPRHFDIKLSFAFMAMQMAVCIMMRGK